MSDKTTTQSEPFSADSAEASQLRGVLDQVRMIATGGMAHIFRARQPSLDRHIAIKKLKDEYLKNPEVSERFRREAKALASVLHQNIAHVYDFVQGNREAYILMEYIDGVDISTVIQKVGNIPPEVAAAMILGVAKGLSYIHTYHLVHRDIKPSNIRINTRGEVKLMDFGIVMDAENQALTRPGLMVGSPSYLSPEQILGDPVTPSADIFLLGITFYEMLTGVRPFKEEGGKTIFQKIRECEYVSARKMNGKVPATLEKILNRCLKKEPDLRYLNMDAVVEDLEKFLGDKQSSHSEQIILKFLDGEALLVPAIPVTQKFETKTTWTELFKPPMIWILLSISFMAFSAGYFAAVKGFKLTTVLKSSPSNYPPSQPVDKK